MTILLNVTQFITIITFYGLLFIIFQQLEYIKQFSGKFLEFQDFFEPLVSLLDKSGMSNQMKIIIIREKLDSSTRKTLKGLKSNDYELVKKTLKDHFYDEFEMQERILNEFKK